MFAAGCAMHKLAVSRPVQYHEVAVTVGIAMLMIASIVASVVLRHQGKQRS